MAFKNPRCLAKDGEYIARISRSPPKSIFNIKTTPAKRMIKASHGSRPGISFNKKKKYKNEPIPNLISESIISFIRGSVTNLPDNTKTVCKITSVLNTTKKY